jgi:hypothetical protein
MRFFKTLVDKSEGSLGRALHRSDDNIKLDIDEMNCEDVE